MPRRAARRAQQPIETLTAAEAEQARRLAQQVGAREAARRAGLDPRTFAKAAAGFPVQRLTAYVLRERLARL